MKSKISALALTLLLGACFHDSTAPEPQKSQSNGTSTVTIHVCVRYFGQPDTIPCR